MSDTGWKYITKDASVAQGYPNTNYGRSGQLTIDATGGTSRRFFIQPFRPLAAQEPTCEIVSALLKLKQRGVWPAGTHTLTIKLVSEPWMEQDSVGRSNGVRFSNKPDTRVAAGSSITHQITGAQADKTEHEIDLTSLFSKVREQDWDYFGFQVTVNTEDTLQFYSSDTSESLKPQFRLAWGDEAVAPTGLTPNAARSTVDPYFHAAFATLAQSWQLQVATDSDFQSVVNDISESGLSTRNLDYDANADGSWSDLSTNTTYYWRCRYTSTDGLTSDWSTGVTFSIKTKPTITITSIADSVTSNSTPTLAITYTPGEGGAQRAIKFTLRKWVNGKWAVPEYNEKTGKWKNGWDSGWISTTGTTKDVPDGALEIDAKYLQIVRVIDSVDRSDVHNDRYFTMDTNEFKLDTAYSVANVTSLTATQQTSSLKTGNPPNIDLSWARSSTPDRFRISRRISGEATWRIISEEVASEYGDASPWSYTDYGAPAGAECVYKVEAIESGVVSRAINMNPFFALDDNSWYFALLNGADAELEFLEERGTPSGKFVRVSITDGKDDVNDVNLGQSVTTVTSGQQIKVYSKLRAPDSDRVVYLMIMRNESPWTLYEYEEISLTGDWLETIYSYTINASVPIVVILQCGDDDNNVDVCELMVEMLPVARVTPETRGGYWLTSEDGAKQIPLIAKLSSADFQSESPGEEIVHPLGNKYVRVSSPGVAKQGAVTAEIDEADGDYLKQLAELVDENQLCFVTYYKEVWFPAVVQKFSQSPGKAPEKKYHVVTVTLVEVEDSV